MAQSYLAPARRFSSSGNPPEIKRESVIDTYQANHGHGRETLELLSNGTLMLKAQSSMKSRANSLLKLIAIGLIATSLNSCMGFERADNDEFRQNVGDQITTRLRVGMSPDETNMAIAGFEKLIMKDAQRVIDNELYLYFLYTDDYSPRDVLETVQVGSRYRILEYWTNFAGGQTGAVKLFLDEDTGRVRGWANSASEYSKRKFMHERLTSHLRGSYDGLHRGMSHEQVYALIGFPGETIEPPKKWSRALFTDHFWVSLPPTRSTAKKLEVYAYTTESGATRRVYLEYYAGADRLISWGYDHAWEEADRYIREHETHD